MRVSGKPMPVYGDGKNVRDWLYVEDHCDAIRTVLPAGGTARPTTSAAGNEKHESRDRGTICSICSTSFAPAIPSFRTDN